MEELSSSAWWFIVVLLFCHCMYEHFVIPRDLPVHQPPQLDGGSSLD
jgi:hypothetical protein